MAFAQFSHCTHGQPYAWPPSWRIGSRPSPFFAGAWLAPAHFFKTALFGITHHLDRSGVNARDPVRYGVDFGRFGGDSRFLDVFNLFAVGGSMVATPWTISR